MNEILLSYFDPEELGIIEAKVQDIITIYVHMEWEQPFDYDELLEWVCQSIFYMRSEDSISDIYRWNVQIQVEDYTEYGWEILVML